MDWLESFCSKFHLLTYLTYSSVFRGEHRAPTTLRHRTLFWLVLSTSAHVMPATPASLTILLRHVCLGRPTFRFPWGFQLRACLVTLCVGFRSVWPIHPHFRLLMSMSNGACLVISSSRSLETTSGHLMRRMLLRHLFTNVCSLWVLVLVTRHVSEPYSRTDFTLVLKIHLWYTYAIFIEICSVWCHWPLT